MTIDVKQAVLASHSYIKSLQEILNDRVENITLEEVERSEDNKFWYITLGFDRPQQSSLVIPVMVPNEREYKLFKVNSYTGEVESMKIREL